MTMTVNTSGAPSVSVREFTNILSSTGDLACNIIMGPPGHAKTAVQSMLAEANGDKWRRRGDYFPEDTYHYWVMDCTNLTPPDLRMVMPDMAKKALVELVHENISRAAGRPIALCMDEVFKLPKVLQSSGAALMNDMMLGGERLPEGSVVWGTSNLVSDGLGDTVQGHVGSRVVFHNLRTQTATEFARYMTSVDADPVMVSFVLANKRCMGVYTNPADADNELIWNPRRSGNVSYCCPRSMMRASDILKRRARMSENELFSAICGTVGLAAGRLVQATLLLQSNLTKTSEIIAAPMSVTVPDDFAAQIMLMINGSRDVETNDDVQAFMQFVNRIPSEEIQAIFFHQMVANKNKAALVRGNAALKDWRVANTELLV